MPRVTTKGQVTIPKAVRDDLGIEPGDQVTFEETDGGYTIRKKAPTTAEGADPFETYRGSADDDETMPERMRRLRGEYPRDVDEHEPHDRRDAADHEDVEDHERDDGDGGDGESGADT